MIELIGILFSYSNKINYFESMNSYDKGTKVVCELERGEVLGEVVTDKIKVDSSKVSPVSGKILRIATSTDLKQFSDNQKLEKKAYQDAVRLVKELKLNMNILNVNITLNKSQLLFNFLADERIDFRELAKKLAYIYKTRIELHQIGVRDKASLVGGYGQCGRKLCCASFLDNLNSVSINMAKNQSLALNPQKINGVCGRLLCCLAYENDLYKDYKKEFPKPNDVVETEYGKGKVLEVDLFNKKYKVELDDDKAKVVEIKK